MSTTKEQQEQQQSVNTTLDQTKENARRRTTINEARKDIPGYTQIIDEYQEQTFQQRRF
jgi:predicted dithiol-disulfide oxidoreductase (DUF899 family)